jgi:signal transduction histidine kinase
MGRRPAALDVLVALGLAVAMQVELLVIDADLSDSLAARAALVALAAAVAVARCMPVLGAALAIAGVGVLERLSDTVLGDLVLPVFVALYVAYALGAYADGRELAAGAAVLLGGSAIGIAVQRPAGGLDDFVWAATVLIGGPVLLGRLVRSRMRLNQALRERAEAVERDRAVRTAGAVADERRRIAGELHHLVKDALESMVGQAAAAERLARSKPELAERAFASVEVRGREALDEIRRLLGVLRRDDEELALAPQPSLAHVTDLIARVRASGLPVELDVQGTQAPLPAGVDLTAYRVVQEALGGAAAEPDARRAAVRLRYGEGEIALEVTDVGEAPARRRRPLLGIHERVALYGGDLVTEPFEESGYAVRARLPLERLA